MEVLNVPTTHEPFVDPERAAAFLALSRKTVLKLARTGDLPGHPVGRGVRQMWRFRLSELSHWLGNAEVKLGSDQGRNQGRKPFS
jgi:excisionase family DNA binding protein